jgi:putative peptide zinc metalloprotease protein
MQNSPTIPWVTRSDLTSVDLGGFNESSFAVKDRIKNEFFSFGELEFFILQSLRKTITLDYLKQSIEDRFDLNLDPAEIANYINRLAHDNLLVARRLGDGERLFRQQTVERGGLRLQQLMGLLSIKLPGFYPGPLLKRLSWVGRVCFHPVSIAFIFLAALLTAIYALLSFQSVLEKAPSYAELVSPNHLLLMMIGFMIAKVLHELGHGLACQNVGHECSEMGVMFLVFLPVLYCDVSDLWTEKNRWKRIFVSLAGVFVELAIATVCFWGWYFSLDGQLGRFLFGMMLVTSVNTLFINGNPLMRYDGYYALSDLSGVPNLAAVSRSFVAQRVENLFVRHEPEVNLNSRGWFLGTYAISSYVYRWMILFVIGWAVWAFFDRQQLTAAGWTAVSLLLLISIVPLILGFRKSLVVAARQGVRLVNTILFLGLVTFCVFLLFNVEFSHRVRGSAEIQLADAKHLFAPADGRLVPNCQDGQLINRGDLVAKIVSDDLLLEKMSVVGQLRDVELRLSALEFAAESSLVAGEIEFWKKRQLSYERKLKEINEREIALEVHSPVSGKVIAARLPDADPAQAEQDLSIIEETRFSPQNRGCHVKRGENLCYIADGSKCTGILKVSEKEIELVEAGQTVKVFLPNSSRFVAAEVVKVSLESQRELANDSSQRSKFELPTSAYLVEFEFESVPEIRVGAVKTSVIICNRTTPVGWLKRWWHNSIWL